MAKFNLDEIKGDDNDPYVRRFGITQEEYIDSVYKQKYGMTKAEYIKHLEETSKQNNAKKTGSVSFNEGRKIVRTMNNAHSEERNVQLSKGIKVAQEKQYETIVDDLYKYKLMIKAALTGMEVMAGAYALRRGVAHLNAFARKALDKRRGIINNSNTQQAIDFATEMDQGQLFMNGIGTTADVGQFIAGDHGWINNAEIGAGTAGIIGATNVVRNTPFFGKYGNIIDGVLDATGYAAGLYDTYNTGSKVYNFINNKMHEPVNQTLRTIQRNVRKSLKTRK